MGSSYWFHCRKCAYKYDTHLGAGFGFPLVYRHVESDAREGRYGKRLQRFLAEHPDGVLNCDRVLLQCTGCGMLSVGMDLSMYVPDRGIPSAPRCGWSAASRYGHADYVVPWELDRYQLVSRYEHICAHCGKPMKVIAEKDVRPSEGCFGPIEKQTEISCPVCREKMILDCIGCWD